MLRDEHRMAAPRRLLAVVARRRGGEPLGDEATRVFENGRRSLLGEVGTLVGPERAEVHAGGGVVPKAADDLCDAVAGHAKRHETQEPLAERGVEELGRATIGLAVAPAARAPWVPWNASNRESC